MSAGINYVEKCLEAVQGIDPSELGQLVVGEHIGSGSAYVMKTLGELSVSGSDVCCGLKIPKSDWPHPETRLMQELTAIQLLLSRIPALESMVPSFMAVLVVEDTSRVAILTEDASKGNSLLVKDVCQSDLGYRDSELANSIEAAFATSDEITVEKIIIDCTTTVNVSGQQRLLDFTPPPVTDKGSSRLSIDYDIIDLVEEGKLTVSVPKDSPLGNSFPKTLREHLLE